MTERSRILALLTLAVGIAVAVISSGSLVAQEDPQTRILSQPDAPISIVEYEAEYQERDQYSREGIRHELQYQNVYTRPVRAIKLGLLSFNVFNDFIDRTGGIDMSRLNPGSEDSGTWVASALSDFSFFTGVAYVEKVRFMDGEIWEADLDAIAQQVREIQADFDAARLTEDRQGNGNQ